MECNLQKAPQNKSCAIYLNLTQYCESTIILLKNSRSKEIATIIKEIREYCEPIFASKFDNLEEIDKFLDIYNLSTLNHIEIKI